MKKIILLIAFALVPFVLTGMVGAETADFENLELQAESYWYGTDGSGSFQSGGATFNNYYDPDPQWGEEYWEGFAYSNVTDTSTEGREGEFNAIAGSGVNGSEIYAIGYAGHIQGKPTVELSEPQVVSGAYFTNNNYAYYSMKNGDQFAKQFEEGDWFKLLITGVDADGNETGTVEFQLAEGTDILDTWKWMDLTELGTVKKLTFAFDSSDTTTIEGETSINTPSYFCMDNLKTASNGDDDDSTCFINTIRGVTPFSW